MLHLLFNEYCKLSRVSYCDAFKQLVFKFTQCFFGKELIYHLNKVVNHFDSHEYLAPFLMASQSYRQLYSNYMQLLN